MIGNFLNRIKPYTTSAWAISFTANMVIGLSGFVTGIITARILNPDGRGYLAEALLWPHLLASLACIYQSQTVSFLWKNEQNPRKRIETFNGILIITAIIGLLCIPTGLIFNKILIDDTHPEALNAAQINLLTLPISFLSGIYGGGFLGKGDMKGFWRPRIYQAISYCILLIAITTTPNATPSLVVISILISQFFALYLYARQFSLEETFTFPTSYQGVRNGLTHAFAVSLSGLPFQVNSRLLQIFTALYLGSQEMGHLSVALAWATIPNLLGGGFSSVIVSRYEINESHIFKWSISFLIIVMFVAVLGFILISPVFGSDYEQAGKLAPLVTLVSGFTVIINILHEIYRRKNKPYVPLILESAVFFICLFTLLSTKSKLEDFILNIFNIYSLYFIIYLGFTKK